MYEINNHQVFHKSTSSQCVIRLDYIYLMSLSTIFQLYCNDPLCWRR